MTHGSAVGAVLSGFFAAAGAYAGTLWGPVSILVGGTGVGGRAFDGRLLQPGAGLKRPRGFVADEEVPPAASAAATTAVAAALVAHAYDGGQKLANIVKPGIQRARQSGADARAELLTRVRAAGAGALADPRFVRELLKVAGPVEGGALGQPDFDVSSVVIDMPAAEAVLAEQQLLTVPWEGEALEVSPALGRGHAIIAIDVRGVAAGVCFRRVSDGLAVPSLELEIPLCAVPVRRGVPRIVPGTRLTAPAPMAITVAGGAAIEIVALPAAANLSAGGGPKLTLTRDIDTRAVTGQSFPG